MQVRRFNFLLYQTGTSRANSTLLCNPDVTVRSRGVMESARTACSGSRPARIKAKAEIRDLLARTGSEDGEVETACQAVCPTDAIVFGDLTDPTSRVAKLKRDRRNYTILEEVLYQAAQQPF